MDRVLWLLVFFRVLRFVLPYVLGAIGGLAFHVMVAAPTVPRGEAWLFSRAMTAGLISGLKSWLSGHYNHRRPRLNLPRNRGRYLTR